MKRGKISPNHVDNLPFKHTNRLSLQSREEIP